MAGSASDIFISYKAEDRKRIQPMVRALEAEGLSVWWDQHIGGGANWRRDIEEHLDAARCVIVAWSERSIGPEGEFVRDEAGRARADGHYLPVTIDHVRLPLGFGETQALDLTGWKGRREDPRFQALLDAVRAKVAGPPDAPAAMLARPAPAGLSRRAVIGGAAVAGLAGAGWLGWFVLGGSPARANSVAVMPFANLSGDPGQAYFSDGLAEELRSALARIQGLKVIGRTSSEALRNDDAETAARKLEVGNILTGSVRRSPAMIRVSAQLVDGRDGSERWSQSFDRANGDALQIQSDIAAAVVEQLRSRLGAADKAAINLGGTSNAAAQDLVLKGDANFDGSREGFAARLALYDAAVALDPKYATAVARKALMTTLIVSYYAHSLDELNRGMAEGEALARQAIALAPDLADAHFALGQNRENVLDFQTGWAEYQRALASPGCSPETALRVTRWVSQVGGFERSRRMLESVRKSDPLNPDLLLVEGNMALNEKRFAQAFPLLERYLAARPTATGGRAILAIGLVFAGRYPEALAEAEKLPREHPNYFAVRSIAAARTGDRARAAAILDDMRRQVGPNGAYQYGEMSAMLGDRDGAIGELKAAVRYRDPGLAYIVTDPTFDTLRGDPRFQAIIRQLNFPEV